MWVKYVVNKKLILFVRNNISNLIFFEIICYIILEFVLEVGRERNNIKLVKLKKLWLILIYINSWLGFRFLVFYRFNVVVYNI